MEKYWQDVYKRQTLTLKIISTMMAANMPIEECVSTVAATLPICSERGVAYSTFTIIRLVNNEEAEIIQFDNPLVILLREGKNYEMPYTIPVSYTHLDVYKRQA